MRAVFVVILLALGLAPATRAPRPPTFVSGPSVVFQSGTPTNPSLFAFQPSADDAVVENGQPVVTKYTVDLTSVTTGAVVKTIDLGHPATVVNDAVHGPEINVDVTATRITLPIGNYTASAYAEGPGGRSLPAVSSPFSVVVRAGAAPSNLRVIRLSAS